MSAPRFSIVTPVHDPPPAAWDRCITSVMAQDDEWEWVIVDDASTERGIRSRIDQVATDERVTAVRLETNVGIVGSTNTALSVARGEFVVFLDHDDELTLHALASVGRVLDDDPELDFLYSDEAKIDMAGNVYDWFQKPEWSPERLRGQNYCNHLAILRRSIVHDVGGLREGFDGAQDHDLLLRVSERTGRVAHIPDVLYLWRAVPGTTAHRAGAKDSAAEAGRRAVAEHLSRVGLAGEVTCTFPGRYLSARRPRERPLVSVIVPTRGDQRRVRGRPSCLVVDAVESVLKTSTYERVEIVVVHDTATPPNVLESLRGIAGDRLRLVEWTEPFDFARKVNLGAVVASGDALILLNDDTQVITADWIEVLLGHLDEPDVGMVGPLLLLSDGRIQSAGHHYHPTPMNLGSGAPVTDPGPHGMFAVAGERTGVTGACAAIRRSVYLEVGGLSPAFPNCYNDVDFGFKLLERGYRIVWTPAARLFHFESLTREVRETPAEADELWRRWGRWLGDDPFARQIDEWWAELPLVPPIVHTTRTPR
jgi:GT2 family glycosyltransferase